MSLMLLHRLFIYLHQPKGIYNFKGSTCYIDGKDTKSFANKNSFYKLLRKNAKIDNDAHIFCPPNILSRVSVLKQEQSWVIDLLRKSKTYSLKMWCD